MRVNILPVALVLLVMGSAAWGYPADVAATALTVSGLSGVHASYLAPGGLDFLIGDGALRYGPKYVPERYYSARLFGGFFASIDLQHIANPAYNQDRGPVWIPSACLHLEIRLHGVQSTRSDSRGNSITQSLVSRTRS